MGWLFSKKEPPGRKEFREEFETIIAKLRRTDELTQTAVGLAINLMTSAFVQRFSDIKTFRALSKQEQHAYIQSLTKAEEGLIAKDAHSALGFGVFKMWIAALSADDEELIAHFSEELTFLSKKGDLPVAG